MRSGALIKTNSILRLTAGLSVDDWLHLWILKHTCDNYHKVPAPPTGIREPCDWLEWNSSTHILLIK